ncbi:MAG: radical SAM protein [Oscillospiraceae bacterium]|jgi:organic radical activating enzyme|nr:radical SAM protein [Oscillospiraceae bacterium]
MKKENGVRLDNLNIIVTDICDRACKMCVNQGFVNTQKRFMNEEVFKRGIIWAKNNGKYGIKLNGGEPTMHPSINEFASFAKAYGLGVYLFSNYSRLEIIRRMGESGSLDRIIISNYDQSGLPTQKEFKTKFSLSTLLWNGRFRTKNDFDRFIEDKRSQFDKIFFETLRPVTQWAQDNLIIDWLEEIITETSHENIDLLDANNSQKLKIEYRGCEIKINTKERASYQRHNLNLDGEIHSGFEWQHDRTVKPIEIV